MIARARKSVANEEVLRAHGLKLEVSRLLAWFPAARLDYVEFFDPQTLEPVKEVRRGTRMALAVFVGKTRLIDNAAL